MIIGIDGNEANVRDRVGSNIYAFELLKHFAKEDSQTDFRLYLKLPPLVDLPCEKNWSYRVLTPRFAWTRWRLPLDLYLHKPRPNVFFTPGHYAPKLCPTPLTISIMDLSFLHYPRLFRKRDLYKLINWTRDSILRADHIFTISKFTKDDIIKNYSVPEKKITVTYPGFDQNRFNEQISKEKREAIKRKYRIEGDYILYLGTLQPRKNLRRLIQAFAKLKDNRLNLVIAGKKGWHYSKIFREGKSLGIERRVIFTGYVPDEDTPALLAGAKGLALVSLYEGFGIPVIEAMAVGIPVVVSSCSSLPEIVADIGILVDPKSVKSIEASLRKTIQLTEVQRKEIAVKSREEVKRFNWKETAKKTLEVLHGLAV